MRRRNLIRAEEYPYELGFVSRDGTKRKYDSGDVPALLKRALEMVGYAALKAERDQARTQGRYIDIGMACCVEDTGLGPFEEVAMSIELDGSVTVRMGTPSQGQGQRTAFAQIVADVFTIPFEKVRVLAGNTDSVRYSIGTFASRAGIVTGSAVLLAARELKDRALQIASHLLEAAPADLALADGSIKVAPNLSRAMILKEIVEVSLGKSGAPLTYRGLGPGMSTVASFCPPTNTFATGCHVAVVEVDLKLCTTNILKYIAVEDFGTMINPLICDGQVLGGVALGIGNTFLSAWSMTAMVIFLPGPSWTI